MHYNDTISRLNELALKASLLVDKNESLIKVDQEIRQFFDEELIIARTRRCRTYFTDYVTPVATAFQNVGSNFQLISFLENFNLLKFELSYSPIENT